MISDGLESVFHLHPLFQGSNVSSRNSKTLILNFFPSTCVKRCEPQTHGGWIFLPGDKNERRVFTDENLISSSHPASGEEAPEPTDLFHFTIFSFTTTTLYIYGFIFGFPDQNHLIPTKRIQSQTLCSSTFQPYVILIPSGTFSKLILFPMERSSHWLVDQWEFDLFLY